MATIARLAAFVRKNAPAVAAVGFSGAILVSVLPQTFGLYRYKELLSNHDKDGKETAINGDLQNLIDRVIHRMEVTPEDESLIEFFVSFPHDPVHRGSAQMRTGGFIGLPATFLYSAREELAAAEFTHSSRFGHRLVNWKSEDGQRLLSSLILSDKAKAFVIARELNFVDTFDIHVDIGLRSFFSILAYSTGAVLNRSLRMSSLLKPWARFSVFSLVGVAWLLMYVQVNDALCCWRESRADRKAALLTRAYAEGGVEYYQAVLERNKALRVLLGPTEGPRHYTLFGNELSTVRNPHVQLTARRDNLIGYLKEYPVDDEEQHENAAGSSSNGNDVQ